MPNDSSSKLSGTGLSLYANLLESPPVHSLASESSRFPVVPQQVTGDCRQPNEASASKQQISAASLRFQPTKRLQVSTLKQKTKSALQRNPLVPKSGGDAQEPNRPNSHNTSNHLVRGKNTLANWTTDVEDRDIVDTYTAEKRQRGGRKNRKKIRDDSHALQNWEDIYDPARPNNYEEYKHSHERSLGMHDWKSRLYEHRVDERSSSQADMVDMPRQLNTPESNAHLISLATNNVDSSSVMKLTRGVDMPDSFASNTTNAHSLSSALDSTTDVDASHNNPGEKNVSTSRCSGPSPLRTLNTPPSIISKEPVHYGLFPDPSISPRSEAPGEDIVPEYEGQDESTRSLRPGQKGFAERLMSKYGWTKGTGLGASGSGIVNPLRVQLEKQKKKPDSEGGGFVRTGGTGKIVGGNKLDRATAVVETGKFGHTSEVVVLRGFIDGMDVDADLTSTGNGGLTQKIGDECSEKAVNALDGSTFNGNTVVARFYDLEKFETGVLDCIAAE